MKNWYYYKNNWVIGWYNIKKDKNSYSSCKVFKETPELYFKKIFHFRWKEYGVEFAHIWNNSHILWQTPKNIYWLIFRSSSRYEEKGKWCFKLMKSVNDHTYCG